MFNVPRHAARILVRERILLFSFPTRLPTRSNYLPPAKEIKGRGRRRSGRRSRLNEKQKEGENQIRGRGKRGSVIYGEGTGLRAFVCACVCEGEHLAPISGCRVSGYAQRVITLSWRNPPPPRLCARRASIFSSSLPLPASPSVSLSAFLPDGSRSIFLMLQRRTPAMRAFTPWRVSRDKEIRLAPRENGVIIYEGGWKKNVNHNGKQTGRARLG